MYPDYSCCLDHKVGLGVLLAGETGFACVILKGKRAPDMPEVPA